MTFCVHHVFLEFVIFFVDIESFLTVKIKFFDYNIILIKMNQSLRGVKSFSIECGSVFVWIATLLHSMKVKFLNPSVEIFFGPNCELRESGILISFCHKSHQFHQNLFSIYLKRALRAIYDSK